MQDFCYTVFSNDSWSLKKVQVGYAEQWIQCVTHKNNITIVPHSETIDTDTNGMSKKQKQTQLCMTKTLRGLLSFQCQDYYFQLWSSSWHDKHHYQCPGSRSTATRITGRQRCTGMRESMYKCGLNGCTYYGSSQHWVNPSALIRLPHKRQQTNDKI